MFYPLLPSSWALLPSWFPCLLSWAVQGSGNEGCGQLTTGCFCGSLFLRWGLLSLPLLWCGVPPTRDNPPWTPLVLRPSHRLQFFISWSRVGWMWPTGCSPAACAPCRVTNPARSTAHSLLWESSCQGALHWCWLCCFQLYGYCYQDSNDIPDTLTTITELGSPLEMIQLLQTSWEDRFRVSNSCFIRIFRRVENK